MCTSVVDKHANADWLLTLNGLFELPFLLLFTSTFSHLVLCAVFTCFPAAAFWSLLPVPLPCCCFQQCSAFCLMSGENCKIPGLWRTDRTSEIRKSCKLCLAAGACNTIKHQGWLILKKKKKVHIKGLALHLCAWNNFRLWLSLVHVFLAQLVCL